MLANSFLAANENDSLFWFDVSTIDNEMPYIPLILNKVFSGKHISIIDSINKAELEEKEVFRIQIFESTVASIARAEANRFQNILADYMTDNAQIIVLIR